MELTGCFLSNLFLVKKKHGGMRPVINIKGLNQLVRTEYFKMERLHLLGTLVKPGDWFTKVDFKDAHFHAPIHLGHHTFLSFCLKGNLFQFVSIPFGLVSVPRTFTKVMKLLYITTHYIFSHLFYPRSKASCNCCHMCCTHAQWC